MAQVQVLLSTWNGEHWLAELLESLERQSFTDWELLVRDDGSQDQTGKLLLEWQQAHPERVRQCSMDGVHLGSTGSFSRLVRLSDAPFLMFCDQDDVWFPEKIEMEYAAMQEMVAQYGDELPLLVHADLALVNAHKTLMAPSFWRMRGFDVNQGKQDYLLTNTVTGCAAMFNRAAAKLAFPVPDGVQYHDRWLALVCAWFGKVCPLEQPLLFYRQHDYNQLGAGQKNYAHVATASIPQRIETWSRQAEIFLRRFGERLEPQDYRLVEALADLQPLRGWERRRHILHHRLFKQGVLANLALLWFA
ncbi:MAG: glycosyltransferase family 2 protein [Thiolinea sp.]